MKSIHKYKTKHTYAQTSNIKSERVLKNQKSYKVRMGRGRQHSQRCTGKTSKTG